MKSILTIVLLSAALFVQAQHTLIVEIIGLEHDNGQVIVALLDSTAKEITYQKAKIENGKSTVVFTDIIDGTYGFKYCHDENNDGEFNTNFIGMPKEGFGFSNNAKVKMKEPPFSDTTFEIVDDVKQVCTAIYI